MKSRLTVSRASVVTIGRERASERPNETAKPETAARKGNIVHTQVLKSTETQLNDEIAINISYICRAQSKDNEILSVWKKVLKLKKTPSPCYLLAFMLT
jgi:hypothetical protein